MALKVLKGLDGQGQCSQLLQISQGFFREESGTQFSENHAFLISSKGRRRG